MTREQAKQNLIALGIEEPSKEQIDNYLNAVNGEIQAEKKKHEGLQAKADKADELQKQLDDINNANLTEIEKISKDKDVALNTVAELQATIKAMEMKTKFAEKGIIGEQAEKLLASLNGGSFDIDVLAQIISDREVAAAQAKELEIANGNSNPSGTSVSGGKEKTMAEQTAENIGKALSGVNENAKSIVDSYF